MPAAPRHLRALLGLVSPAAWLALAAGCEAPPPPRPGAASLHDVAAAVEVAGDWRWAHISTEDGTRRREREHWQLERVDLTSLRGSYLREVEVETLGDDDGLVFTCNQRPRYRQQARFDVTGVVDDEGVRLDEVAYQVAPSPCDPGLRELGHYRARVDHTGRLVLVGATSVARLTEGDGRPAPPLQAPPRTIDGDWTWSSRGWTGDGLVQLEDEAWHLAASGDDVTGSYVRTVAVLHPDGTPLPCAGVDRYQYVDRYQITGKVTAEGWRLREASVVPGTHPCLRGFPGRTVDEATAAIDGEYLVLEWRGPRRQVLARVTPATPSPW